jgi:hypothetical protein
VSPRVLKGRSVAETIVSPSVEAVSYVIEPRGDARATAAKNDARPVTQTAQPAQALVLCRRFAAADGVLIADHVAIAWQGNAGPRITAIQIVV